MCRLVLWEESGGFGSRSHLEGRKPRAPGTWAALPPSSQVTRRWHSEAPWFPGVVSGLCTQGHMAQSGRQPGPGSQPSLHADAGSSAVTWRRGPLAGKVGMWAPWDGTEMARPLPSSHRLPRGTQWVSSLLHACCSPEPSSLTSVRRPCSCGLCPEAVQHLPWVSPHNPHRLRLFLNWREGCASETPASSLAPKQEAPGGPGRSCCCSSFSSVGCSCPAPPEHRHRAPGTGHRARPGERLGRGHRVVLCARRTDSGPCLPGVRRLLGWEGPGSRLETLPLQRHLDKQADGRCQQDKEPSVRHGCPPFLHSDSRRAAQRQRCPSAPGPLRTSNPRRPLCLTCTQATSLLGPRGTGLHAHEDLVCCGCVRVGQMPEV